MMEEMEPVNEIPAVKQTPVFLKILCILTFISTGSAIITSLVITPMADVMILFSKQMPGYDAAAMEELFKIYKAGWGYHLTSMLFSMLSLAGALFMWNGRRNGFHFYTIANIILFYLPIVWLGLPFHFAVAFISAAFVAMYALHRPFMK